ncbi:MAG: HlyD family type I secretion periplasmic adaptor subunit [Gammaproteobacteria bacterium]
MSSNASKKLVYQHLPACNVLEDIVTLKSTNYIILLISMLIILLLAWASLTKVNEISHSQGILLPYSNIHAIQHLEGGIIKSIYVKNGDQVKQHDVLIELDKTAALAELSQLHAKQIAYLFDAARLRSFLSNKTINFDNWLTNYLQHNPNHDFIKGDLKEMLTDEILQLNIQKNNLTNQLDIQENKIDKLKLSLAENKQKIETLQTQVELTSEEYQMHLQLQHSEYISKRELIRIKRELNKSKGDLLQAQTKQQQIEKELSENIAKLQEITGNLKKEAIDEIGNINAELLQIQKLINKYQDIVKRTTVKAPISGTVKGLNLRVGSVIAPQDEILEVVPNNDILYAETHILPKDIGHIRVGAEAVIKIITYDYARYGTIPGKVSEISATTFQSEKNQPYYLATVTLDKQFIKKNNVQYPLKSGMSVEVNIKTGSKSILQYLLKPVHNSLSSALHER